MPVAQIEMQPGVLFDSVPLGTHFGDVTKQPASANYKRGQTVAVEFRSANPRSNLRHEGTFLTVELATNSSTASRDDEAAIGADSGDPAWVVVASGRRPAPSHLRPLCSAPQCLLDAA